MSEQQQHMAAATAHVGAVMGVQRKLVKGIGLALMIVGGVLCLTIIGAVLGIPLLLIGAMVYFIGGKVLEKMHKAVLPPTP